MMKQVELKQEVQDSHARLAQVEARLQQIEQEGIKITDHLQIS